MVRRYFRQIKTAPAPAPPRSSCQWRRWQAFCIPSSADLPAGSPPGAGNELNPQRDAAPNACRRLCVAAAPRYGWHSGACPRQAGGSRCLTGMGRRPRGCLSWDRKPIKRTFALNRTNKSRLSRPPETGHRSPGGKRGPVTSVRTWPRDMTRPSAFCDMTYASANAQRTRRDFGSYLPAAHRD